MKLFFNVVYGLNNCVKILVIVPKSLDLEGMVFAGLVRRERKKRKKGSLPNDQAGFSLRILAQGATQSVCVVDCYFIVNGFTVSFTCSDISLTIANYVYKSMINRR